MKPVHKLVQLALGFRWLLVGPLIAPRACARLSVRQRFYNMESPDYRQQTYPTVAQTSLPAGGHEMNDPYGTANVPRSPPQPLLPLSLPEDDQYLTPYLGLKSRLSQVWINRWTVLLLLVLVRLLIATGSIYSLIDDARTEALAACIQVQNAGSTFASLPHYMAKGVNTLSGEGITKAVSALVSTLDLMVTGVEQIILFYIGFLTDTYVCLITAAVSASIGAVTGAVEAAQGAVNTTIHGIASDIGDVADGLQSSINGLLNGINTVFGSKAPTVDFTKQIAELNNFTLPKNLDADLVKLNASVPTFAQVKNFTNNLISIPFNDLKTLINDHLGNYTFDKSVFPVPQVDSLEFCSDNNDINNFFDDLKHIASVAEKVFIAVLLILAVAACVPAALMEIRRYRSTRLRAVHMTSYAVDAMDAVYIASRPFTANAGHTLSTRFQSDKFKILCRWFIAYITTFSSLILISLALTGFFSCFCQFILLKVISKEIPAITAEITGFADQVIGTINNASEKWATDANLLILNETNSINHNVLGWVNTSTSAVNATLNGFIDESVKLLNETFGGTVFYQPILNVFDCLIGFKVAGIEEGLTWVSNHAQVNFPLLPNDTMTLGDILQKTSDNSTSSSNSSSDLSSFLSNPGSATQDGVTEAINKVSNAVLKSIRQEALIATMLLVAWLVVVCIGLGYVIWRSCSKQQRMKVVPHNPDVWYSEPKSGGPSEMYQAQPPAPVYYNAAADPNLNFEFGGQESGSERFDNEKNGLTATTTEAVFPQENEATDYYYPNQGMTMVTKQQSRFSN